MTNDWLHWMQVHETTHEGFTGTGFVSPRWVGEVSHMKNNLFRRPVRSVAQVRQACEAKLFDTYRYLSGVQTKPTGREPGAEDAGWGKPWLLFRIKHFPFPLSLEISDLASRKKTWHVDGNSEISYVWEGSRDENTDPNNWNQEKWDEIVDLVDGCNHLP
jgi:hypothetical protein